MDLNHAIWLVIGIGLFALGVWGGFTIITKFQLGRIAQIVFGVICLVIVAFLLVYLANGNGLHRLLRAIGANNRYESEI